MIIEQIRIENFRSIKDQVVELGRYNCLVGPNGSGKSTVLNALNVFFREAGAGGVGTGSLCEEDFHCRNTAAPIRITLTFGNLSSAAAGELKHYVRMGKLIVSAVATWDPETKRAEVVQHGERMGLAEFKPFFQAVSAKASSAELKELYGELQRQYPDLPKATAKDAMVETLHAYEGERPDGCVSIPSPAQFYGFSKGENRLAGFIQYVFVPAVKDATSEEAEGKNTALGQLLQRTVRSSVSFSDQLKAIRTQAQQQYDDLLAANQSALDKVSGDLAAKLGRWAHPGASLSVKWDRDADTSVRIEEPFARIFAGEGGFEGELGRLGHGLQRSYLLALLHLLSANDDPSAPTLLLAVEEPELFQHPPQAQHMAEVLEDLSVGNAQVLACTHSPFFVVGKGFEDVRLVRKDRASGASAISAVTFEQVADQIRTFTGSAKYAGAVQGVRAKIHQALQPGLKEMFFCPVLVLVEGLEDVAYIRRRSTCSDTDEWRRYGGHIVPVNGKSEILQQLIVARALGVPTFVVFDADGKEQGKTHESTHRGDNLALMRALGMPSPSPFPTGVIWGDDHAIWPENLETVKGDLIQRNGRSEGEAETTYDQIGNLNRTCSCR